MVPRWQSTRLTHAIGIVITLIVILTVLILYSCVPDQAEGEIILTLPPSKWDTQIIALDKRALDEAYIEKLKQLFNVWVREGRENPERPVKGAAEARRAYVEIMQAIEKREQIIEQRK